MYKAHFKNITDEMEKNSSCVLGISVGEPYHENGKLRATLELLKNKGVEKFIFLVADTLQRYTLSFKASEDDKIFNPEGMEKISIENGEKWTIRNKEIIKILELTDNCEFIHWNNLRNSENYISVKNQIENMLKENSPTYDAEFFSEVENSVNIFFNRQIEKNSYSETMKSHIKSMSKDYIIEECSGLMVLLERKHSYFAYPGKILPAFNYLKDKLDSKDHLKFLNISIRACNQKKIEKISDAVFFKKGKTEETPTSENLAKLIDMNYQLIEELTRINKENSTLSKSYSFPCCTIL